MFSNSIYIFHTFLDPCFNTGESLTGVARGDAEFVVAIHSNSGGLGKRDPLGKLKLCFFVCNIDFMKLLAIIHLKRVCFRFKNNLQTLIV